MSKNKNGFTLIEMLVVIAIIAIMVSMLLPTINSNVSKAQATTDAANLRNVLGQINAFFVSSSKIDSTTTAKLQTAKSVMFPEAKTYVLYCETHFVDTYYVVGNAYYGIDFFADVAKNGSSNISTSKPVPPAGSGLVYEWFEAGKGAVTEDP